MKKLLLIILAIILLTGGFMAQAEKLSSSEIREKINPLNLSSVLSAPQQKSNQRIIDRAVLKGQTALWKKSAEKQKYFSIVLAVAAAIILIYACFKSYLLMKSFELRIMVEDDNEALQILNGRLKNDVGQLENRLLAVGNERSKFVNEIKAMLSGREKGDFLIQAIQKKLYDELNKISKSK